MKKLYEAWSRAIEAMDDPRKNATNPHFRSRYADLGQVLACIREPLKAEGLALFQTVDTVGEGSLSLVTTLVHLESMETRTDFYPLIVDNPTPQALGKAITYARRYSLKTMFMMVDVDDDGEEASKPVPPKPMTSEEALSKIKAANSLQDLLSVYNQTRHLDNQEAITAALAERKTTIIQPNKEK